MVSCRRVDVGKNSTRQPPRGSARISRVERHPPRSVRTTFTGLKRPISGDLGCPSGLLPVQRAVTGAALEAMVLAIARLVGDDVTAATGCRRASTVPVLVTVSSPSYGDGRLLVGHRAPARRRQSATTTSGD